jgi:DNA mismatch endonuclease (patch repair protein)
VIFVHGCFWHGHTCRKGKGRSKTNVEFWNCKIDNNKRRDRRNIAALRKLGWESAVVWECQLRGSAWVARLIRFLSLAITRGSKSFCLP